MPVRFRNRAGFEFEWRGSVSELGKGKEREDLEALSPGEAASMEVGKRYWKKWGEKEVKEVGGREDQEEEKEEEGGKRAEAGRRRRKRSEEEKKKEEEERRRSVARTEQGDERGKPLSYEVRKRVMNMMDEGVNKSKISRALGLNYKTVCSLEKAREEQKIVVLDEEGRKRTMGVPLPEKQGGFRWSRLNEEQSSTLVRIALEFPTYTISQIRRELMDRFPDLHSLSTSTVQRVLASSNVRFMKASFSDPRAVGNEAQKEEMASFLEEQKKGSAGMLGGRNTVFMDETVVYMNEMPRRAWGKRGETPVVEKLKGKTMTIGLYATLGLVEDRKGEDEFVSSFEGKEVGLPDHTNVLERGNHLSFSHEEEGGGWGQPSSPPSFFLFWWIRPPTRNNVTLPLFLDGEDAREDMREQSTLDSFLQEMDRLEEKTGRQLHKMLWERGIEFREVGQDGSLVTEKIGSTSYNVLLTPSRSRSLLQDYLELVKHALDLGNTLSPTPPDNIPRHFLSRYGRNNRGGSLFSERGDRTLFLRYLSKMMTYAEQSFPKETTENLVIAWDSAPQHGKVSVGEKKRSFIHTWAEENLLAHKKPIKGVVFLPVRQPDFNPAELLFAFVKSTIRRRSKNAEGELSVKETVRMIDSAMMDVTESMVKGWVRYGCYQIPGEDWSSGLGRKKMCGYDSDFMFLKRAAVEKWEKEKERLPPLVKNDLLSGYNLSHLSRFRTEEEAMKVGFRVKEGKVWREGRVDEKKEDGIVTGKKNIVSHDMVLQKDGNENLIPNLKLLPSEENALPSHFPDPPFPSSYSLLLDLLLDVGRASSFLSPPPQKEKIDSFLSSLDLSHLRRASSLSVDMASVFSSFFEKPPSSSSNLILDSMERVLSDRDASKRVTLTFLSSSFSGDKQEMEVSVQKDTDTPFSSGGRSFLTFSSLSPPPFEVGSQRVAVGRIKSVGDAHFLVSLSPGNGEMRLSNMRVCDLFPSLPPKKVSYVSRILSLTPYKHSIPPSSSSSPPSFLSLSTILVSVLSYDHEKKEAMRKKESLAEKVGLVLRSSSTWSEVSFFCEKEGAKKGHPPLFDVHKLREKRRAERKLLSLSSRKGKEREEGERRWPGYPITEGEYHEEVGKVPPPVPKEVKSVFSIRLSGDTEEGYEVHISFSGGEAEEVMRLGKDEKPLSEEDRETYEKYFNEMSEENVSKLLLSLRRVDERRGPGTDAPDSSSNLLLSTGSGGFKFREEEQPSSPSSSVLLFDKDDSSLKLDHNQTFSSVSSDKSTAWSIYTKERDGYRRLKEGGRIVKGSLSFLKSSYGLVLKRRKVSDFSKLRLKRISSGSYFSTQRYVPQSDVDLTFPSASLGEDKIYLKKGGSGWCVFREGEYYDVFSKKDIQFWCDSHLPDDDFDALSTFTTSSRSQVEESETILRLAEDSTRG